MLRAPLVSIAVYFRVLFSMQVELSPGLWVNNAIDFASHSRYVIKAISKQFIGFELFTLVRGVTVSRSFLKVGRSKTKKSARVSFIVIQKKRYLRRATKNGSRAVQRLPPPQKNVKKVRAVTTIFIALMNFYGTAC